MLVSNHARRFEKASVGVCVYVCLVDAEEKKIMPFENQNENEKRKN